MSLLKTKRYENAICVPFEAQKYKNISKHFRTFLSKPGTQNL